MAQGDLITELHRSITGLSQDVGRIEGKIDTFIAQMKSQDDRTIGLEARTRKIENRQYWYSGAGAVIGAILGRFLPTVPHF